MSKGMSLHQPAAMAGPRPSDALGGRAVLYPLAFAGYLGFAAVFQVFPPFLDDIQRDFGVGRTVASLTMTGFLVPLVLTAFVVGAVADRRGHRGVGGLGYAILLVGAGLTVAAESLAVLLAARALAGLGGGMVLVATLRMLAAGLPPERLGAAFGLFIAGLPAGTGLAFLVFNHLGGWRESMAAAGVLTAAIAVAFALVAPRGEVGSPADAPERDDAERPGARRILWHLAALVALGYMAIVAFTTWAPSSLESYAGLSAAATAAIASLLLLIDLPFAPLWGRVSDRLGRRRPFVVASFLVYGIGAALLAWVAGPQGFGAGVIVGVVAAMGIGCAMFFPATLAIPAAIVPGRLLGRSYGLFLTAQAAGMAAGPLALGAVFAAGSTPAGLLVIAGLSGVGFLASLPLRTR